MSTTKMSVYQNGNQCYWNYNNSNFMTVDYITSTIYTIELKSILISTVWNVEVLYLFWTTNINFVCPFVSFYSSVLFDNKPFSLITV